jgi:hypothetical protein
MIQEFVHLWDLSINIQFCHKHEPSKYSQTSRQLLLGGHVRFVPNFLTLASGFFTPPSSALQFIAMTLLLFNVPLFALISKRTTMEAPRAMPKMMDEKNGNGYVRHKSLSSPPATFFRY